MSGEEGGGLVSKATVTRTRSGNLRGSVDPQALARELETLRARVTALEHALAPAMTTPHPRPRLDLDSGLDAGPPRQASVTTGQWGARHDPRVMRVYGTDMFPAVLRSVEEEQARQAIERQRGSDIMWRTRDGTPVRDGTGAAPAVPRQTSTHPGDTFWNQFPDHQRAPEPGPPAASSMWNEPAGAGAGFMTARGQTLPPRQPEGDVLRGL